jgi:hypothetical protein
LGAISGQIATAGCRPQLVKTGYEIDNLAKPQSPGLQRDPGAVADNHMIEQFNS